MKNLLITSTGVLSLAFAFAAGAETKVVTEHLRADDASPAYKFKSVPPPCKNDAASNATFTLVDGRRDNNGGDLAKLHDGLAAMEEDAPADSFFFRAGTDGGRIAIDLGKAIEVSQVNSYSWHANTRGPQVYKLYASDGTAAGFEAAPKRDVDPAKCGWKLLASVDTRPATGEPGGQYAVSVSDSTGSLGSSRYLLFDILHTEDQDGFGNTFFSEIDVLDRNGPAPESGIVAGAAGAKKTYATEDGKYQFVVDSTDASDLSEWAEKELIPVVKEWYPKLVKMLPSDGYEAPAKVTLVFKKGMGGVPAAAGGSRVSCNIDWFRRSLKGEAKGSVVHELVHVVQQYGRARRTTSNPTRTPGWVVEGIPDYIRWFLYEPQTKGAEVSRRGLANARYDASYRVTGNFLNWVTQTYDKELVRKLNAVSREGKYTEAFWKENTGHTVQELGDEWKRGLEKKLGVQPVEQETKKPTS